jgi:hypothetical protein
MRSLLVLFVPFVVACGPSTPAAPPVTCPNVQQPETAAGSCDLVGENQCSDGNFYEIDCQDDGTCTCSQNGTYVTSFVAEDEPSGYCATFTPSLFHSLSVGCGWNLNPS